MTTAMQKWKWALSLLAWIAVLLSIVSVGTYRYVSQQDKMHTKLGNFFLVRETKLLTLPEPRPTDSIDETKKTAKQTHSVDETKKNAKQTDSVDETKKIEKQTESVNATKKPAKRTDSDITKQTDFVDKTKKIEKQTDSVEATKKTAKQINSADETKKIANQTNSVDETKKIAKPMESRRSKKDIFNFTSASKEPFNDNCDLLESLLPLPIRGGQVKPDCKSSSFLVYRCSNARSCGGLGDRTRAIITSFIVALALNRTFIINHDRPCWLSQSLVPRIYDWQHCAEYAFSLPENETETLRYTEANYYKDRERNQMLDYRKALTKRVTYLESNLGYGYSWAMQDEKTKQILPGLFKKDCRIMSDVLHILFTPSPRLAKEIDTFLAPLKGKVLVGSHIRVGKNPSNPFDGAFDVNTSSIYRFLDKYNNSKEHVIYIASDSLAIREHVLRRYPNAVSSDQKIMHVDQYHRLHQTKDEQCRGLFTGNLEMQLLARCDILVLSRGGFGGRAADFRTSRKDVFCLDKKTGIIGSCPMWF